MDAQELIGKFLASEHGAQATQALQQQGVSADDAQTYLTHAAQAVTDHVNEHASSGGLLGDHPGKSFFAAFAAGLLKGDGVMGALGDGAEGVVTGRVAEALAEKAGLDTGTAATLAAAATPYVMAFMKQHLGI
jgi:hypothetical protein